MIDIRLSWNLKEFTLVTAMLMLTLKPLILHAENAVTEFSSGGTVSVPFDSDVLPPLPQSSSIKQYETPSPSLSTGALDLSIELCSLEHNGFQIPFSLHYGGEGIHVYDDCFPCGIGWVLKPGLRITRTIMGRPDELYRRIPLNSSTECYDSLLLASLQINSTHPALSNLDYVDTRHDIFIAHLPGSSHTFVLDRNELGGWDCTGDGMNNITVDADSMLRHFTVTDGYGIRYEYGGTTEYHEIPENVTSWMLERVTLINGDTINFVWDKYYHTSEAEFGADIFRDCIMYSGDSNDINDNPAARQGNLANWRSDDPIAHLKKVIFPQGSINFDYRVTFQGTSSHGTNPLLTSITMKNLHDEPVRQIVLDYDSVSHTRHFLERININGEGAYSFEYNKVNITYAMRYAQDWWGFYNAQTTNESRVPQIRIKTYANVNSTGVYYNRDGANRSVDTTAMKANILTAVHYPTGGVSYIEYEPHRWLMSQFSQAFSGEVDDNVFGTIAMGGGLRVKRITTSAGYGLVPEVTTYCYGENEDGMAHCEAMPLPHTFVHISNMYSRDTGGTFREVAICPESSYLKHYLGETPIWYSEVTEYRGGGKTLHFFENFSCKAYGNDVSTVGYGAGVINKLRALASRGVKEVLREEYTREVNNWKLLNRSEYHYSRHMGSQLSGDFTVKREIGSWNDNTTHVPDILCWRNGNTMSYPIHIRPEDCYSAHPLTIEFYTERLDSVTNAEYTPNGALSRTLAFSYVPGLHDLVAAETLSVNGVTRSTKEYTYPFMNDDTATEMQEALRHTLTSANRIATPVKTVTTCGVATSTTNMDYGKTSSGLIMPLRHSLSRSGATTITRAFEYDGKGNPSTVYMNDSTRIVTYLWGHERTLPVAAVAGMTRSQVASNLGQTVLNAIEDGGVEALSQSLATSLPGGLVKTLAYHPLVGVSSCTLPNGRSTTFDYDNAGHLTHIRDWDSLIIERFIYHVRDDIDTLNYTETQTMTTPDAASHFNTMCFYDGLGRPFETIESEIGGNGIHNVSLIERDEYGRPWHQWLPIPTTTFAFNQPEEVRATGSAFYSDSKPYTRYTFLDAPTDSIVAFCSPGQTAENYPSTTEVFVNDLTSLLRCASFVVTGTGVSRVGWRPVGDLRVVKTIDENGHITFTFHDWDGKVVLERRIISEEDEEWADTYYVFDDYRQLRLTAPPMAAGTLAQNGSWTWNDDELSLWCYGYTYDALGRMIAKRLPGREPIEYLYDKGGNEVFFRDGNLRHAGKWQFTLRDRYGREAVTGFYTGDIPSISSLSLTVDYTGNGSLGGYSPATQMTDIDINWEDAVVFQANYFDSYDFLNNFAQAQRDSLAYKEMNGYDPKYVNADAPEFSAWGNLTGTLTRVLGDSVMLACTLYRDHRGNIIQRHEQNLLGGYDHHYLHCSFTGDALAERHDCTRATGECHSDVTVYSRDSRGRVTAVAVTHDGETLNEATIARDEVGRTATLAQDNAALTTSYGFDLRGRPLSIDCPVAFSEKLKYEFENGDMTVTWNGGSQDLLDAYHYKHDGLGRLVAADFRKHDAEGNSVQNLKGVPNYSTQYAYDLNSNMTSLKRHGLSGRLRIGHNYIRTYELIDDVELERDGNRVVKATDTCEDLTYAGAMEFTDKADKDIEYTYDANGNLTADHNRGVTSITYNELNLPREITFADGHVNRYTYAADGRKLRVTHLVDNFAVVSPSIPGPDYPGPVGPINPLGAGSHPGVDVEVPTPFEQYTTIDARDYCGNYVWRNDSLERVTTDYGYFDGSGNYYAYVKDHQDNVRAVLTGGNVVERNNYYPYGMLISGASTVSADAPAGVQPLKHTSKELDRLFGLDYYDFTARYYDPSRCEFLTPDPLTEDNSHLGPTTFCASSPLHYSDPTGLNPIFNYYGQYIGSTREGYTGLIYVYGGSENVDFKQFSIDELSLANFYDLDNFTINFNEDKELLSNTLSNIWTHVVSRYNKKRVFDERFTLSSIKDGKIFCALENKNNANWTSTYGGNGKPIIQGYLDPLDSESTVENITTSIIAHEWYSHIKKDVGDHHYSHHLAYWAASRFPLFFKTTIKYQQLNQNKYDFYKGNNGTSEQKK